MQYVERLDRRLLCAAGEPDLSFGNAGRIIVNANLSAGGLQVAVQNDRKIVVTGIGGTRRFLANGAPDPTFTPYNFYGYDLAVQPDGKILLAGAVSGQSFGTLFAGVARLNVDGSPDATFSGDGIVTFGTLDDDANVTRKLVLLSEGRILAGGYQSSMSGGVQPTFIARINPNGELDSTFGTAGISRPGGMTAVRTLGVQSTGKIVFANSGSVRRLTANGASDTANFPSRTFTGTGINSLIIQADDRIVLGAQDSGLTAQIRRLQSNGANDDSFGTHGLFQNSFGRPDNPVISVLRQPDGKYVGVGYGSGDPRLDMMFFRVDGAGVVDSAFGAGGVVFDDWAGPDDYASSGFITPDLKLLAGGGMGRNGATFPDIDFDGTIGRYGLELTDNLAPSVTASSIAVETSPRVALKFSEVLDSATIAAPDLIATQLQSGQTFSATSVTIPASGNTVEWSFPASIPDGNYRFRVPAGAVADWTGNAGAADIDVQGQEFFIFAGDANRDRAVNISDFAILAARFNLPGTFSQGDFNYDGVTNISDFAILASKFNTTLPAPSDLPLNRTSAPLTSSRTAPIWIDRNVIELVDESTV